MNECMNEWVDVGEGDTSGVSNRLQLVTQSLNPQMSRQEPQNPVVEAENVLRACSCWHV